MRTTRGVKISELEDYKVCDWCGGLYDLGFKGSRKRGKYCSYECSLAYEYHGTLLLGIGFTLGSISLYWFVNAFPDLSAQGHIFGTPIFLILAWALGLPMLWCARDSRRARMNVPRDSRKGRRVDEPLE